MSRRAFIVLGIVALVVMAGTLIFGAIQRMEYAAVPTQRLLPELEERLNEIGRIQVRSAAAQPFTLERRGEVWQVVEKGGYPADFGLLRQELLTLARLEKVEAMTRSADKYAKLGLQDLDRPDSQAREIRLWAGDRELAAVLVGKTGSQGGSYVRLAQDPQSWLTSDEVTVPAQPQDWLNKELLNLIPNRVHRIAIQPAQGAAYSLIKGDPRKTEFTLDPAPEEGKRLNGLEVQRAAAALNALRLDDVLPESQMPPTDTPWQQARFETFDGLVIEAATRQGDDKRYLKLAARFDPTLAQRFQSAASAPDAKAPAAPQSEAVAPEQVKAEAERLQQRFAGWVFVIPDHKANLFSQARDKLIEAPVASRKPEPPPAPLEEGEQPLEEELDTDELPPAGEEPLPEEGAPVDEELPAAEELPPVDEPLDEQPPVDEPLDGPPPADQPPARKP